jgi:periplasmic protein TonB
MRTWTLALSISAHAAIVVAIFVAPIFAAADLPEPRRPLTFEAIMLIETPTVPLTREAQPARPSTAAPSYPVTEPTELPPDAPPSEPPPPSLPDVCDSCGVAGFPIGDGSRGHDVIAPPAPMPPRKEPVPVGGVIRPPTRIVYVAPVYPQIALASRKEGTVILQAIIDENGAVREVNVLRSISLLDDAAVHAVSQWKFTPTTLNGNTVPVVMTVTVTFTLQR